jgi:hypothetical protein
MRPSHGHGKANRGITGATNKGSLQLPTRRTKVKAKKKFRMCTVYRSESRSSLRLPAPFPPSLTLSCIYSASSQAHSAHLGLLAQSSAEIYGICLSPITPWITHRGHRVGFSFELLISINGPPSFFSALPDASRPPALRRRSKITTLGHGRSSTAS